MEESKDININKGDPLDTKDMQQTTKSPPTRKIPPPSMPPPNSHSSSAAVATYRARAVLPPPSTPPTMRKKNDEKEKKKKLGEEIDKVEKSKDDQGSTYKEKNNCKNSGNKDDEQCKEYDTSSRCRKSDLKLHKEEEESLDLNAVSTKDGQETTKYGSSIEKDNLVSLKKQEEYVLQTNEDDKVEQQQVDTPPSSKEKKNKKEHLEERSSRKESKTKRESKSRKSHHEENYSHRSLGVHETPGVVVQMDTSSDEGNISSKEYRNKKEEDRKNKEDSHRDDRKIMNGYMEGISKKNTNETHDEVRMKASQDKNEIISTDDISENCCKEESRSKGHQKEKSSRKMKNNESNEMKKSSNEMNEENVKRKKKDLYKNKDSGDKTSVEELPRHRRQCRNEKSSPSEWDRDEETNSHKKKIHDEEVLSNRISLVKWKSGKFSRTRSCEASDDLMVEDLDACEENKPKEYLDDESYHKNTKMHQKGQKERDSDSETQKIRNYENPSTQSFHPSSDRSYDHSNDYHQSNGKNLNYGENKRLEYSEAYEEKNNLFCPSEAIERISLENDNSSTEGQQAPIQKIKIVEFMDPKTVPVYPSELKQFVTSPFPVGRGHILRCFIERNDHGPNKLAPLYTLMLEINSSSGRPVIYARRMPTNRITTLYVLSLNREDLYRDRKHRSVQYLGKVRSNAGYTEYKLYDTGENPENILVQTSDSENERIKSIVDNPIVSKAIRSELAVINFTKSKKETDRNMEVAIPSLNTRKTTYTEWKPLTSSESIAAHFAQVRSMGGQNVLSHDKMMCFHKRQTKYDPLSSCIVDFKSRATCVSIKNFQLVHSPPVDSSLTMMYHQYHKEFVYKDDGTASLPLEHVILQMGKVGKDCFNMDFQYPLSMLQAFAICLSRFDTRRR